MATKPKTPAQVAAEKKVAVERAKVNAQKAQQKPAMKKEFKPNPKPQAKAPVKTVTGKSVTVTAKAPMKKVTGPAVTVTGKRPMAKPNEGSIYLVKKGGKNVQVEKSEYDKFTGPKDIAQRDKSGFIVQKGSNGKRTSIDYEPLKGWKKW